jgi:UDP-2,4-diacetamido-2,4,6-trideoxy-beta-L-altropyranose hydrolase
MSHLTIRADASFSTGVGHVMRCLGLAHAWKDTGGRVTFLTRNPIEVLAERIRDEGFDLRTLNKDESLERDIEITSGIASGGWVVIDGYQFSENYLRSVRCSGCRVLAIDDTHRLSYYDADIVLNQNPGFTPDGYRCPTDALLLLGPQYTILRREFRDFRPKSTVGSVRNILITMGGSDPNKLSSVAIKAVKRLDHPQILIRVILGPANPWCDEITTLVSGSRNIEIHVDPGNFTQMMAETDVAITAGGSTCWELAYLGIPAIVVVAAENQEAIARELHEWGVAESLGQGREVTSVALADHLLRLIENPVRRREMSHAGHKLVDGRGAERIINHLQEHDQ